MCRQPGRRLIRPHRQVYLANAQGDDVCVVLAYLRTSNTAITNVS